VATVSRTLSAIAAADRAAGHTLDTREREIRVAMKAIRKTIAAPQGQALERAGKEGVARSERSTARHALCRGRGGSEVYRQPGWA